VFLPSLAEFPMLDEFADEMTLLLMDNCSGHILSDVIRLATQAGIRVITFAPPTTQTFQVFDLTLLGVLKRHRGYGLSFGDEKATVKFRMKVYHDFEQTIVEPNISEVFQALGFEFNRGTEPCRFFLYKEKLTRSADFRGLSSIDFPWINCRLGGMVLESIG
jgi:hypothetical protein